jgi:hypothetical protein
MFKIGEREREGERMRGIVVYRKDGARMNLVNAVVKLSF